MRAHYFQHVPFEGLGCIETSLRALGYEVTATRLFESQVFPRLEDIDFLIIMGGPMSVNDEERFPWIASEKSSIRSFIETGKPVLGICLGLQRHHLCLRDSTRLRRSPRSGETRPLPRWRHHHAARRHSGKEM